MTSLTTVATSIDDMRAELVAERVRLLEANCQPDVLATIDTLLAVHDAAAECIARDTAKMVEAFQEILSYTRGK